MKKYLLLIALLATQILCANGFDNLKALQDRMPALVAQVNEDLGGPRLAPEVPYIAGLLEIRHSPAAAVVGDEATYIYDVLRTASNPHSKAVFEPHGLDREKKAALNQFDYTVFRYDRYLRSGHTVFGIAAQEHPPVIQKIVIERIISGNPVAISAVSAPAGGGGMGGGLFAGGVPALKKRDANAVKPAATSPAVAKPAPKSLLVRVQEYKEKIESSTKANDIADVAILTELENELAKGAIVRNDDEAERYNSLVEFFGYLENPPSAPATQARVGRLRMDLKPKATVASPPPTINVASASPAVVSSGGDAGGLEEMLKNGGNTMLAKAARPVTNTVASSGNAEADKLMAELQALKARKEKLEEDEEADDWDEEDDEKPKKSAAQIQSEREELLEIDAAILERAEALAIHPAGRLDPILDQMRDKVSIYQRIFDRLGSLSRSKNQDEVYQQVNAKLRSLQGGVLRKSSSVAAPVAAGNLGTGAVVRVDDASLSANAIQTRIVELTGIPDTQNEVYQKDRYLSAIRDYLSSLITPGAEGATDRKTYLTGLQALLESVEITSIGAAKRSHIAKIIGDLKAKIKTELASRK